MRRETFIITCFLAFAASGWSQSAPATATIPLAGHVTDLAFKRIPNVAVTLKTIGSDIEISRVETDPAGEFRFPAVPSGAHELHFEKAGFMPVSFPIQTSSEEKELDIGSVILQKAK